MECLSWLKVFISGFMWTFSRWFFIFPDAIYLYVFKSQRRKFLADHFPLMVFAHSTDSQLFRPSKSFPKAIILNKKLQIILYTILVTTSGHTSKRFDRLKEYCDCNWDCYCMETPPKNCTRRRMKLKKKKSFSIFIEHRAFELYQKTWDKVRKVCLSRHVYCSRIDVHETTTANSIHKTWNYSTRPNRRATNENWILRCPSVEIYIRTQCYGSEFVPGHATCHCLWCRIWHIKLRDVIKIHTHTHTRRKIFWQPMHHHHLSISKTRSNMSSPANKSYFNKFIDVPHQMKKMKLTRKKCW